jgi:predicted transcriptional regulator
MDSRKIDPLLTAEIVGSYLRHHKLTPDQLPNLIASVHRTLGEVGQPSPPENLLTPAVSVRQSVRSEFVTCLDCGYKGKTLSRHLSTRHGFSRDEYLKRWGLRKDHLLTAPAYSERRSTLAKSLGLGRKRAEQVVSAATPAAEVDVKSAVKRRGRPRSGSKFAVLNEAAADPMPGVTTGRRSRVVSPEPESPAPTAET